MKPWIFGTTALVALSLGSAPALALTAQETWDNYRALAEGLGQTVTTASETPGSGTLTVSGIELTIAEPESSYVSTLESMVFTEQSDGSVRITMSDRYVLNMDDRTTPEAVAMQMVFAQPDAQMVASEIEGGVTYALAMPEFALSVASMTVNGEEIPMNFSAIATNVTSTFASGDGDGVVFDAKMDSLALSISGSDPEETGDLEMSVTIDGLSLGGTMSGALYASEPEALRAALAAGAGMTYQAEIGATAFAMGFEDEFESFRATGTSAGGTAGAAFDAQKLELVSTYRDFAITAQGSEIPLPQISAAAGEFTTNFLMPLAVGDAGQDYGLRFVLGDVVVGEEIWSMIDPAGAFPRDPATVLMDLAGTAKVLVDIFDENSILSAAEPAEVESLTINDLRVALGGAELTGTGGFTFDYGNRGAFGGMPAPDGVINLALSGGNKLLDALVNVGLLPQDQASMARMMTGFLARPGEGPDTLVSEIEIRPDGTILANGAPLPF